MPISSYMLIDLFIKTKVKQIKTSLNNSKMTPKRY